MIHTALIISTLICLYAGLKGLINGLPIILCPDNQITFISGVVALCAFILNLVALIILSI